MIKMNARERYLSVFDENQRQRLDCVPTHVQYIRDEFINLYKDHILQDSKNKLTGNLYFDIPYTLGFDSIFASFTSNYKIKSLRIVNQAGKSIRISYEGQPIKRSTDYYEGGFIKDLDLLNSFRENTKYIDVSPTLQKLIKFYEKISPNIFPILTTDGIYDRVWRSMGMVEFSLNFRKNSKLYRELIKFYAHLTRTKIEGLINATGSRGKVVNILDDVAYKGRAMISPSRWESDILPYYKEINKMITDAGMIPQIHSDGDVTELIPSLKQAGFSGLQGFEGGCDPYDINEKFPDFVVIGFGDVSHVLPYGNPEEVKFHVDTLMRALKENRHFIIGPSTVIYEKIPLENVKIFLNAVKIYGKY